MSGLVTGYTAGEWEAMADRELEAVAECRRKEAEHRRAAAKFCDEARRERTEARRRCKHPHTTRSQRNFSDDSYSQWTESVLVCKDCGEWWRERPGMSVEEDDE